MSYKCGNGLSMGGGIDEICLSKFVKQFKTYLGC